MYVSLRHFIWSFLSHRVGTYNFIKPVKIKILKMWENLNLINILFMQLTFTIVILSVLVNLIEKYLPTSIKQMFRYGKHAHKDDSHELVEKIEIPKAWFSHFYIFAIVWSWMWLVLAVRIYFFDNQPHSVLIAYLDLSCGKNRSVESKFMNLIKKLNWVTSILQPHHSSH